MVHSSKICKRGGGNRPGLHLKNKRKQRKIHIGELHFFEPWPGKDSTVNESYGNSLVYDPLDA